MAGVAAGGNKKDDVQTEAKVTTTTAPATTTSTTEAPTTTSTIPVATVKAEITAEAKRACDQAIFYDSEPEVKFNSGRQWDRYTTEAALIARAKRCADDGKAAKAAAAAAAEQAAINNAAPVNVDQVVKNPDAVKGQVFVLVSEITQFDGATGTCAFRGYWDNSQHEYSFDYAGDNAFFTSGDGESNCPILAGIDQNDVVRLTVRGAGTYSYDTQAGGNTTVPSFDVLKVEVIAKK